MIAARKVIVPVLTSKEAERRDDRQRKVFQVLPQPDWGQTPGLQLKPFQVGSFYSFIRSFTDALIVA